MPSAKVQCATDRLSRIKARTARPKQNSAATKEIREEKDIGINV
jgi:hypothetical protein